MSRAPQAPGLWWLAVYMPRAPQAPGLWWLAVLYASGGVSKGQPFDTPPTLYFFTLVKFNYIVVAYPAFTLFKLSMLFA